MIKNLVIFSTHFLTVVLVLIGISAMGLVLRSIWQKETITAGMATIFALPFLLLTVLSNPRSFPEFFTTTKETLETTDTFAPGAEVAIPAFPANVDNFPMVQAPNPFTKFQNPHVPSVEFQESTHQQAVDAIQNDPAIIPSQFVETITVEWECSRNQDNDQSSENCINSNTKN